MLMTMTQCTQKSYIHVGSYPQDANKDFMQPKFSTGSRSFVAFAVNELLESNHFAEVVKH